jgi:XFP N-terminal domain
VQPARGAKPRRWGLRRVIVDRSLDALFVTGPGHGGLGLVANTYLEDTYSEVYSAIGRDEEGLRALSWQFSFPGGIPSHVAPETPGSIHEGGELGYALLHAYGAVLDKPRPVSAVRHRRREAEPGPMAASWHSDKSSTRSPTAPCSTSTATKSPTQRCWPGSPPASWPSSCAATATRPISWQQRSRVCAPAARRHAGYRARRHCGDPGRGTVGTGDAPSASLADDRAPHPEGLDRPEDRRWPARRGHLTGPTAPPRHSPFPTPTASPITTSSASESSACAQSPDADGRHQ